MGVVFFPMLLMAYTPTTTPRTTGVLNVQCCVFAHMVQLCLCSSTFQEKYQEHLENEKIKEARRLREKVARSCVCVRAGSPARAYGSVVPRGDARAFLQVPSYQSLTSSSFCVCACAQEVIKALKLSTWYSSGRGSINMGIKDLKRRMMSLTPMKTPPPSGNSSTSVQSIE